MFDTTQIAAVLDQAERDKWPYPRAFDALKAAGVTRYDTIVSEHAITYFGEGGLWKAPIPAGWKTLETGSQLDKPAFLAALKRSQTGQTSYATFLAEIAQAGCTHYRVDMAARTVSYMDDRGEQLTESIPPAP